jgi:hypothetical protein
MIDTVKIDLEGFEVRADSALTVNPAPWRASTGESQGDCELWQGVRGRSAYLNAPLWNLDVKPLGGKVRAMVHFSIPRIVNGESNVEPATATQAHEAFQRVESELDSAGISARVSDANLSRVDLFRNVRTDYPFREYRPLFRILEAQRMKDNRAYSDTGVSWGNTQQQITAYDKVQEVREKLGVRLAEVNLARFELRMMNKRKIWTTAGLLNVGDVEKEWDRQSELYNGYMGQTLFRWKPADIEMLSVKNLERAVEFAKVRYGRYWLREMLATFGVQKILEFADMGTVVDVLSAHMSALGQRKARHNVRKILTQKTVDLSMMERRKVNAQPVAEMYQELHAKVVRLAA